MFHVEHCPKDTVNLDLLLESTQNLGCILNPNQLKQLHSYVNELLKWNKKSNLTGFNSKKDVIGNLIADSLAANSLIESKISGSIIDVGTGGGIPGIPLKIVYPSAKLTLVEPNQKKVAFLHHMIGILSLKNTSIEAARMEQVRKMDQYHESFDWVVIKALSLKSVLPYVSEVLSDQGRIICWRAETMRDCGELCGFQVLAEVPYLLPFGFGPRILSVLAR